MSMADVSAGVCWRAIKKKAFICTAKHFKHSFLQAQFRILHHDIAFFSFIAFHMLIKMPGACRG